MLQALSQRIHYGKYVAEAKFRAQEEVYREQVERQDADALMHLLTDVRVEQQVRPRSLSQKGRPVVIRGGVLLILLSWQGKYGWLLCSQAPS